MFEDIDDAERYKGLLEAQDFPVPSIELIDKHEIELFCENAGYVSRLVEKGFVPEKFVVTFKPGKEMEERVKELERQAAAKSASQNAGHNTNSNSSNSQSVGNPPSAGQVTPAPSSGETFSPTTSYDPGTGGCAPLTPVAA